MNVGDVSGPRWVGAATNPDPRDAEVEALRAENEKLQARVKSAAEDAIREHARTVADTMRVEFGKKIIDLTAENIVLRQQLANMTTEQRLISVGVNGKGRVALVPPYYEERLVSPWTAVEGGN